MTSPCIRPKSKNAGYEFKSSRPQKDFMSCVTMGKSFNLSEFVLICPFQWTIVQINRNMG